MTAAPLQRAPVPVAAGWLSLREPADTAARPTQLADRLRSWVADRSMTGGPLRIHDLGAGTGAMTRWLAPRLPAPQHWVLHDVDADLLRAATTAAVRLPSGEAAPVTVETRRQDITRVSADDLRGADLITASALLDLLTHQELDRVVGAGVATGCPLLFSLTVVGRATLTPTDPLDPAIGQAFNRHQRRRVDGGRLLGSEAPAVAVAALRRAGHTVLTMPSPWLLTAAENPLLLAWLDGWVGPAVELRPDLAGPAAGYLERRGAQADRGLLAATVRHLEILALPGGPA
jgi:SAM-dependent methyltransferase